MATKFFMGGAYQLISAYKAIYASGKFQDDDDCHNGRELHEGRGGWGGGLVHHTHGREGVMRTHNEKDPAELSDGPHQAHHRGGNGDEATDDDECCPRHIAAPCEDSIPVPRDC